MWKNIRKKAFENKKNECFICKKITNLQVHHIKYGYKNLTMLTNGLRIVCNNCHKEIHLFSGNVNRKTRKYKNTCLSGMY